VKLGVAAVAVAFLGILWVQGSLFNAQPDRDWPNHHVLPIAVQNDLTECALAAEEGDKNVDPMVGFLDSWQDLTENQMEQRLMAMGCPLVVTDADPSKEHLLTPAEIKADRAKWHQDAKAELQDRVDEVQAQLDSDKQSLAEAKKDLADFR
jgi:hypothetical protein